MLLFVGIAVLGAVPTLTAYIFLRRARQLYRTDAATSRGAIALGVVLILAPAILAQSLEWSWINARLQLATGSDPKGSERALRDLADYPLRLGRGEGHLCNQLASLSLKDDGVMQQMRRIYGPYPIRACELRQID
jgi:hypothetical protein